MCYSLLLWSNIMTNSNLWTSLFGFTVPERDSSHCLLKSTPPFSAINSSLSSTLLSMEIAKTGELKRGQQEDSDGCLTGQSGTKTKVVSIETDHCIQADFIKSSFCLGLLSFPTVGTWISHTDVLWWSSDSLERTSVWLRGDSVPAASNS